MAITVRPVTTIAECRHIEEIAFAAWGGGAATSVPDHLLITLVHNQGVVLLAWADDRPVGFTFTFPSFYGPEKTLKHCSHMAGVLPAYQSQGVGERLKWAQRAAVLAQGIGLITWTYDPLETRNGWLNLHKLGAVCQRYRRDVYGDLRDGLNEGLASDRFEVAWWLETPWVTDRVDGVSPKHQPALAAAALNDVRFDHDRPVPAGWHPERLDPDQVRLSITVPASFQSIKMADFSLAQAWRAATRLWFEAAFAAGYTAVDLVRSHSLCHYILAYNWQSEPGHVD